MGLGGGGSEERGGDDIVVFGVFWGLDLSLGEGIKTRGGFLEVEFYEYLLRMVEKGGDGGGILRGVS